VAVIGDDAPAPELIQSADECLFARASGALEDVDGELAPDRRGGVEHVARRLRQLGEPGLDDRLHSRREHSGVVRPAGAQRLDDEERIALGLPEQAVGVDIGPGQHERLLARQASQLDLVEPPGRAQRGHQLRELAVDLLAARGRRHEQRRVGGAAQQVMDELERLAVGPVQVVGHEQQGGAGAHDGGGERVEQAPALLALGQRLGRQHDLRQHAGQLGQAPAVQAHPAGEERIGAQPGRDGAVGEPRQYCRRPGGAIGSSAAWKAV
jgi:hypothetical protein